MKIVNQITKFRTKTIVVDAVQFFKNQQYPDITELVNIPMIRQQPYLQLLTYSHASQEDEVFRLFVNEGDWIVRDSLGRLDVLSDNDFRHNYELDDDQNTEILRVFLDVLDLVEIEDRPIHQRINDMVAKLRLKEIK